MKNVLTALWALVVAGSLVCLTFQMSKQEPAQPAAKAEPVMERTIEMPPGVEPMSIQCGDTCLLFWDPMSKHFVAAMADGSVVYVKPAPPAEESE